MAQRLLLPSYIINHFVGNEPCSKCRRIPRVLPVKYPSITTSGRDVVLLYRGQCVCGGIVPIRVQLPILFFGYILARQAVLNAPDRSRRSTAEIQVSPHHCELIGTYVRDFRKLIAEILQCSSVPTDLDRLGFSLGEREWADFLRRLGLTDIHENGGEMSS